MSYTWQEAKEYICVCYIICLVIVLHGPFLHQAAIDAYKIHLRERQTKQIKTKALQQRTATKALEQTLNFYISI